jgi:hypothetical protein
MYHRNLCRIGNEILLKKACSIFNKKERDSGGGREDTEEDQNQQP